MDGSSPEAGASMDARAPSDGAPVDSPFITDPMGRVLCPGGEPCACDNGIDDDGDGFIDDFDPECTGPFDDDEGSFATGIPGDNMDFCQDCFFDGNSGHADDMCPYHTDCLYGRTPPPRGMSPCFRCTSTNECRNNCLPRVPNGCDCFGCCEAYTSSGTRVTILLEESCSLDKLEDSTACTPCVQSTDCVNKCDECELCLGRTLEDLPESCMEPGADAGTPTYTCPPDRPPCDESNPCDSDHYCLDGCCASILI